MNTLKPILNKEQLGRLAHPLQTGLCKICAVWACLALAASVCLTGCSGASTAATSSSSSSSQQDQSTEAATAIDTAAFDFEYSKRDLDASWDASSAVTIALSGSSATVTGSGATAQGNVVSITAEGTYVLQGTFEGNIIVNAPEDAKVQVVLNNANITSSDGPAVDIQAADKVFITLADGTQNTLADSATYSATTEEDGPNATVYSKADLCFNGTGALTVTGTYKHAVNSKDDLIVTGGTYTVTAAEDTLRGKDCVKICGGTFNLNAQGDCIKSSNDTDADRGFVSIDGGTFTLNSANDDGVQAAHYIRITDGTLNITVGDDAIHSDNAASIQGGTTTISSGDDAIHAEFVLEIAGGTNTAQTCYEGFEGETITISGGTNFIKSSDDAINAAAGSTATTDDTAATNDRAMGKGPMTGMEEGGFSSAGSLTISGGTTVLETSGDGLDSNGNLTMTGGVVLLSGPENSANGCLDYDSEATITGGTIVAVGSSGMAQSFGSNSTQASVVASVSGNKGDLVSISDAQGNVLATYTAACSFNWLLASTPAVQNGTEYTIGIGGTASQADSYGFSTGGTVTGATDAGSIAATTEVQGSMGMGGMHGGGGMDGKQNMKPDMAERGGQMPSQDGTMPQDGTVPQDGTAPQQGNGMQKGTTTTQQGGTVA